MDLMYTVHQPAGDGRFPTIVALHGWGANAHDLLGLAPYLHGGEALVLCPQGPMSLPTGPGATGYGWFPITGGAPPDAEAFASAVDRLAAFLDSLYERYPVDPGKLVLLGFSQGGVMAYALALREPRRYAALVALSSWLPEALAGGVEKCPEDQPLPIFISHGTEDPMIPVVRAQESNDRLRALGYAPIYREYAMQHEIRPEALRDLVGFLDEKVLGNPLYSV